MSEGLKGAADDSASAPLLPPEKSRRPQNPFMMLYNLVIFVFPQDASGDLKLTPLASRLCNWCTFICIVMAIMAHFFCDYAEQVPPVLEEDPWVQWCLLLTATLALGGFLFEGCLAACIKIMGLQARYEEDLTFRRRLRLNRKMMVVFTFLSSLYYLMSFNVQVVHMGWLAQYCGGRQIVYSLRYIEWTCCAPIVLSVSGQLEHAPDGSPRNGLIPSSLLTGIYCIISWQGLVVVNFWWSCALITFAFVSYAVASVEQLRFAWYLKDMGQSGPLRAGLLTYLVIMIGIYGVVYLLPIPGWISPFMENKFYCFGDASFKLGTSIMLLASNDLANNEEMRRRAEAVAEDLTRLIEQATVPIFSVNREIRIEQWNNKIAELTGMPEKYAIGKPLLSMFKGESKDVVEHMIRDVLEGGGPSPVETTLTPPGIPELSDTGEAFVMKTAKLVLSATPRKDDLGIVARVTMVGYDMTEIQAFKEAEARKTRLMAVVSHELRSPLHGIIGLVDRLSDDEKDAVKVRFLTLVKNCATRLLDLVVNIMEMASMAKHNEDRASKTSLKLFQDPVELPKIIEEVVLLIRNSTDKNGRPLIKRGIELVNNVGCLPIIEGDAHKCTQVFYNLVTNACKFTAKGRITVSSNIGPNEQGVEISVTDTGVGIAKDALERIFEPFEQEDNSEGRHYQGIGLGLSIAKEVVSRHGGHIRVKSELGVGTTFTVSLPTRSGGVVEEKTQDDGGTTAPKKCIAQESKKDMKAEGAAPPNEKRKLVVLSVDDDMVNQTVMHGIMSDTYEVHKAMDGTEALEYLSQCEALPDVMLLDVMMPGLTGHEVCKQVRKKLNISPTKLPILMVSASATDEAIIEAFKAGCNDYITKPFHRQLLRARVEAALRIKVLHEKEVDSARTTVPMSASQDKEAS